MKLGKLLITLMTIILLSTTVNAQSYTTTINNKSFKFNSQADLDLFNDYNEKLKGMPEFANELVKGKKEFIRNIIKTKRFDRYKTQADKIARADKGWESIIRNLFKGMVSSGYKRIPKFSPNMTQYIIDNFDILSMHEIIGKPIVYIKQEYNIIINNKIADNFNKLTGK